MRRKVENKVEEDVDEQNELFEKEATTAVKESERVKESEKARKRVRGRERRERAGERERGK